ncbi:uncharacterized protein LOC134695956 [Mytilus trossulus]|uniref:uncharacterized protein LOC134695956 n=1 Tax=Mytilus trossulus TaxID=6551 RepID=UPI003006C5AC
MSDENPKATPTRGVSQISDESGYFSIPPSPGMLQVSVIFKGVCKPKIHQNFGFIKEQINPEIVIEEVQSDSQEIFSSQKLSELRAITKNHKKTDHLVKHLLRKGEGPCKCFLKCLQNDNIQANFILEQLKFLPDKSVPITTAYNIDLKDFQENFDCIVEELETTDVIDPLLEYYIISLDDHDDLFYTKKTRKERNSQLIHTLIGKKSDSWIPGFVFVLDHTNHSGLLSVIQHKGKRILPIFTEGLLFNSAAYEMSIKVNGLNASSIELQLAQNAEIDNICRRVANLTISNIRRGSVLLMVHPISPDTWRKSSDSEKMKLLEEFVHQLLESTEVRKLIQKEINVTIDVNEIKNVFGDPLWRVRKSTTMSPAKQQLEDNWTFLTEELEIRKVMEYLVGETVMSDRETQTIMQTSGRKDRTHSFLRYFKENLADSNMKDLIDALVKTGQTKIAKKLKTESVCIDCLRETCNAEQNYNTILDEMVSSMMLQTVAKFDDEKIPHHIKNILTPQCGKSRRDRAHLFMQYVLVNDDVLRSFEDVFEATNSIDLDNHKCTTHKPGTSKSASYFQSNLVETNRIHCSFTVRMEANGSLSISSSFTEKEDVKVVVEEDVVKEVVVEQSTEKPLEHGLPSEPYIKDLKDNSPVVAAIDFGTTYSGFAFSHKRQNAKIITKQWQSTSGTGLESFKTPTSILLDPENKFCAFGYEAEEKYDNLSSTGDHKRWHFFKHFKMKLHSSETLKRETIIEDVLGNTMAALDIFTHSIRYLKQQAENLMRDQGIDVGKENISWIITIPAIWTDAAKQFMREAAEKASIPADKLTLALEPEVASIYIGAQNLEKSKGGSELVKSAPGSRFMVVDIGGGTVDITVMETVSEQRFKQISLSSGGPHGGKKVNENIIEYLTSLVGENVMDEFRLKSTYDYHQLSKDIELSKRNWKNGGFLKLNLPMTLVESFASKNKTNLSEHLKSKHDKEAILRSQNKLRIASKKVESFMISVISEIIVHVEATLKNVDSISYMVIVGGFAENTLLKKEFNKTFSGNTIIVPNEAGLAVLKGAVLYGHDPSCVVTRKCDRTYGTLVYRAFFDDDSPAKWMRHGGSFLCKDAFNKLVEIGESITLNEKRSTVMQPLRADMSKMSVKLYGSTEPNPRYVTDKSCTYLGKILVDIPERYRSCDEDVIVSMTFGQTEIVVEGKSQHSEHAVTTKLDCFV